MSSVGAIPSSTRRPIRRLARETVERIAAGEVVERPASVVKELLENALDAGASLVTVRLVGGGLERVEVADDGEGIPSAELELAVERHATSKLPPEGPVERVASLGFRGEALAAIASVARLRLLSRPPGSEVAEGLSVVGGTVAGRFAQPRAPGTTVEVEELFFNTPVRRKFLKSPAAEQVEASRVVERTYLARPNVTFRLEADGRELAVYPATSGLRDAAARVLGAEFLRSSFEVAAELPGGRLFGALGRPPLGAAYPGGLYFAVNGRAVTSRSLQQAVRAAYGDSLPRARYPVGVLHLEVDPERLDVNVHPTKREVRLLKEREVVDGVRLRVRESLIESPSVAEVASSGPLAWRAPRPPPGPRPAVRGEAARTGAEGVAPRPSGLLQERLGVAATEPPRPLPERRGRPRLELLGCVQALYWVGEAPEGLVVIDQHAASERVLYEALRAGQPLARQTLVEPVPVRLSGAQRSALVTFADELDRSGFRLDPFGPETYRVLSVPTYRGRRARPEALTELLDELIEGGRATVPDGLRERTAATLACHSAIRAGDVVDAEAIRRVLEALADLPGVATTCPHGRPILLTVPRSRLDRWFLRSGP